MHHNETCLDSVLKCYAAKSWPRLIVQGNSPKILIITACVFKNSYFHTQKFLLGHSNKIIIVCHIHNLRIGLYIASSWYIASSVVHGYSLFLYSWTHLSACSVAGIFLLEVQSGLPVLLNSLLNSSFVNVEDDVLWADNKSIPTWPTSSVVIENILLLKQNIFTAAFNC